MDGRPASGAGRPAAGPANSAGGPTAVPTAGPAWGSTADPGRRTAGRPATFQGPPPAPTGAQVELLAVSRWYGNVVAVNEVTFSLDAGITGLLGPNGAGKSTILSMVSGLLKPSAGTVAIEGRSTWRDPSMYRRVGLVPERESLPGFLTGRAFVEYNARLQGVPEPRAAAARAIEEVDLAPSADRELAGYSKGMRQRIKVAAALVHEPRILVLDEPFNGMDPRQRLHMMELLRRMAGEGRVILFSSHILEEVERLGERILVIVAGRLAASGDYREIRRLMTDRPHTFTISSSDDRRMASALMAEPSVFGVEVSDRGILARTADFGGFSRAIARVAQAAGVSLWEVVPTDESLESVFAYLVQR